MKYWENAWTKKKQCASDLILSAYCHKEYICIGVTKERILGEETSSILLSYLERKEGRSKGAYNQGSGLSEGPPELYPDISLFIQLDKLLENTNIYFNSN